MAPSFVVGVSEAARGIESRRKHSSRSRMSQSQRSASVSGMPADILSMLTLVWYYYGVIMLTLPSRVAWETWYLPHRLRYREEIGTAQYEMRLCSCRSQLDR